MTKLNSQLANTAEEAIKSFEDEHKKNISVFKTNLNELRTTDKLEHREHFLKMVKKHLNIFYYTTQDLDSKKKDNITFYINFGKEHEKVQKILKCDGVLFFKEDAGGVFSNQISLNNIEAISPFLKYLLEFLSDQFSLLNFENITKESDLIIFNKKAKALLKEKHICIDTKDEVIVMLKGLGTSDFINIPIKQINLKIIFDTTHTSYVYISTKTQLRKLFLKEGEDGKKGQDCKELLKWIETNKGNDNRTKYCIIPSQINISKTDFEEYKLAKKYKNDYESRSDIQKKLRTYFLENGSKIININMKFCITILMNITSSGQDIKSDFDAFDEDVMIEESPEQKEARIVKLHKGFKQMFGKLITDGYIEETIIKKTNIEIKDNIFKPCENIDMEEPHVQEDYNNTSIIKKVNKEDSDDETSDIDDSN